MPKPNKRSRGRSKDELFKPDASTEETSTATHSTAVVSSSGKRKKSKSGSPELISMAAVQSNMYELHKIRIFSSISAGTTAGILDVKGLYGFALFAVVTVITAVLMALKMNMSLNRFFRPLSAFITTSLWEGLTSFVLFWTLFANILYLYG